MTNVEKTGAALGIAASIFALGAGWQSINSRFEKLNEKIEAVEKDQTEGLCLTIMKSHLAAIEKGKVSVRDQLQGLSDRHCPSPNIFDVAHLTVPMTPEERRAAEVQEQQEYIEAMRELIRINDELDTNIRAECSESDC